MQLSGTQSLPFPPDVAWQALFDPVVLAAALPGCESLEKTSDTTFDATIKLKIGPVSARFKGSVEITDSLPPHSCTLTGKGSGGLAGFANGAAKVVLTPSPEGTMLSYEAEAAVGGKLAALGNRLLQSTAERLATEFFAKFSAALTTEPTSVVGEAETQKGQTEA